VSVAEEKKRAASFSIVLVGRTGAGKSSTGNVLFSDNTRGTFNEVDGGMPAVHDPATSYHIGKIEGLQEDKENVLVVDTIGLDDQHMTEAEIVSNISKSLVVTAVRFVQSELSSEGLRVAV